MRRTALPALLVASVLALAACGGGSSDSAASGPGTTIGVTVTGEPGKKPTLEIPDTDPPATTSAEVLDEGDGATVASGDVLVVDYLGQTWEPKDGEPNVFDNSYDRGQPSGFAIGVGQVVKGWDNTLVGQKVGSRVLLSITPADGYGTDASTGNELAGQTLVFVVDIHDTIAGDGVATGTVRTDLPKGLPTITSASGERPEVTSVKDVKAGSEVVSELLIEGEGDPIDATKQLVLQFLQTDSATGKQTQTTWDQQGPQVVPAESVLSLVTALSGKPIGSRAVAVTPDETDSPSQILVLDVIGQF